MPSMGVTELAKVYLGITFGKKGAERSVHKGESSSTSRASKSKSQVHRDEFKDQGGGDMRLEKGDLVSGYRRRERRQVKEGGSNSTRERLKTSGQPSLIGGRWESNIKSKLVAGGWGLKNRICV